MNILLFKTVRPIMETYIFQVLKKHVALALKTQGYDAATNTSLDMFTNQITTYINEILRTYKSITLHSLKSRATITDILYFVEEKQIKLNVEKDAKKLKIDFNKPEVVYNSINIEKKEGLDLELLKKCYHEGKKESKELEIERHDYIYNFMPMFPNPITYKRTYDDVVKDDRPKRIKLRVEQSLAVEDTLFRMLKNEKKIKNYVNYLYDE